MTFLHDLTAAEQLGALRSRRVSSRELTTHYLERIDRLESGLGSFVTVTAETALAEADRADECLARGEGGALTGLPLGIKDLFSTAGVRTTLGSAALADHVPETDSWTVGLLRRVGAVLVGKTNTAEFGATCFTENTVSSHPAVTPYDPTRSSSGSSGGAATAVAAGLLPLAHASDGAGSIRTPAATCHLIGFKPSRGLVSTAPATSFFSTSTEGPLARTVEDAALLMDVMAQPSAGDLYGWRSQQGFAESLRNSPRRALRVAVWTDTGIEGLTTHPESLSAVERTTRVLEDLGHRVRRISLPARWDQPIQNATTAWFAVAVATGVGTLIPPEGQALLTPFTQHLHEIGAALTGADYAVAQGVLARYASTFLAALQEYDVVLTPSTNGPPVRVGHFLAAGVEGVLDRMRDWSCFTPWTNLAGVPAVALPTHLDHDGLPHGVQLIGRQGRDTDLLMVAHQLEDAQLWDDVHPTTWT